LISLSINLLRYIRIYSHYGMFDQVPYSEVGD
jgi:hypothetical protein